MGIQTIIDNAQFVTVNKTKTSAQSISRSGRLFTTELASAVPYRFTVGMHSGLTYSQNRGLLEDLDGLDRTVEETVDIGTTNTGISYITAYLGDMASVQQQQLRMNSSTAYSGANLYVDASTITMPGGSMLFRKGDFIQPDRGGTYRYPYQVTADVPWSTSNNITVPVHRPVIAQSGYTMEGDDVQMGPGVKFRVKMLAKPLYSIIPYDRIEFNSDFELIEVIE